MKRNTRAKGVKFLGKERKAKFLWIGEKDKRGGVGILIREELEKEIVEVKRISTRIIKVKLILGENLMHVISAYVPQGG